MSELANLIQVILGCLALGSIALMAQPLLGWKRAIRYTGWLACLILAAAWLQRTGAIHIADPPDGWSWNGDS